MARITKNDRTITLTQPALKVYDSWPHMEKSKRVSEAIISHGTDASLEQRITDMEARLERLERINKKLKGEN